MRPHGVNHFNSTKAAAKGHSPAAPAFPLRRAFKAAAFVLSVVLLQATSASAQGILAPGDAVVTGFSGIKAPDAPVPPGTDPLDSFHIDLDGASARTFRLGLPGAPPQGQLVSVPAPYKVLARDVGQVFAITFDDSPVPNIYLGATSAFGIQIVGPDANGDGRPDRLKKGQANAQWMPGQFGTEKGGGPGSIYKVDGRTGAVTLFATIPGNSGAGLGDIVFDKASRHFFVSDLDTGLIHRLDANGALIGSFDHGIAGRTAAGLPAVADDGATTNITAGGFDVENPDTWGFTQPERRVWGIGLYQSRLYYAVADGPQVWSVGINADGSFAGDARLELTVTGANDGQVISDIVFDAEGRMYLAQRGEIRGSYDYSVFADPEQSAVLRYRREQPDDPATPGLWLPVPEEYAIGVPPSHRNAAGGIALGYGYDGTGTVRRGFCNRMLWSTGDNLRNNQAHADKLGDEGPLDVHGLQGNDPALVRPQNEPPFNSYFVDYDSQFGDPEKAGHVGDVEIWQPCEGEPGFSQLMPGYPPPDYVPPGDLPPPWLPPGDRERPTNLRLEKKDVACWKIGGDKHRCGFRITVTNTGPGVYHDHIKVRDRIPDVAGVTATFSSPKFDACPGGPPAYTCTTLAPVHLLPWEEVSIPVRVDVPDDVAKKLECRVTNRARILHAPSPTDQNTNPADDADEATAHLPEHLCKDPPKEQTNLKITKNAISCGKLPGTIYIRCKYHVRVWNMGPGDYNDKIEIFETFHDIVVQHPPTFGGPAAVGWTCNGNPVQKYTCTSKQVLLKPGESVLLVVKLDMKQDFAEDMECKLKNTAKITYAPGGGPKNTNPGDDEAEATGNIPAKLCKHRSNLMIDKRKFGVTDCPLTGNATWCKAFRISVWNEGPSTFVGQIKVRDLAPANTKVTFFDSLGKWTCNANTKICQTNGNVVLHANPPVNDFLAFIVNVSGDDNDAKALNCKLKNTARIIDPVGGPKNTKAADDQDQWTYDLPAELCEGNTNLELTKRGYHSPGHGGGPNLGSPDCPLTGNATWCKKFRVHVQNRGPGIFHGQISVRDLAPNNTKVSFNGQGQWTCNANSKVCHTNGNVVLKPNDPADILTFTVNVSGDNDDARALNCRLANQARIINPVGAPKNTQAADDQDQWTYGLPAHLCATPASTQEPTCPSGSRWNGDRCGPQTLIPPPPPPPPPPSCPYGQSLSQGHCCPTGLVWTGRRCGRPVVEECPEGTVGRPPYCRKVEEPKKCPRGLVGQWPDCQRPEPKTCPTGMIGTPPNCKRPEPKKCPAGMIGTPPNCKRPVAEKCPSGMTGRPPNCKMPQLKRPPMLKGFNQTRSARGRR